MKQTILPSPQLKLWEKLSGVKELEDYYLGGGTAIALHLQHRESIDFVFFSQFSQISPGLIESLKKLGELDVTLWEEGTFSGVLSGVRISFFHYPYPLLNEAECIDGLNVASLDDLVAMKIIAIGQRGTKKDFIDLHTILNEGWNFEAIFDNLGRKYRGINYNKAHLLKSLVYFEDADADPLPTMIKDIKWKDVKDSLRQEVRAFVRIAG